MTTTDAPLWWHDGGLSLLRAQMQEAQRKRWETEGDAPPGLMAGTPHEVPVREAREAAFRAEAAFVARFEYLRQDAGSGGS